MLWRHGIPLDQLSFKSISAEGSSMRHAGDLMPMVAAMRNDNVGSNFNEVRSESQGAGCLVPWMTQMRLVLPEAPRRLSQDA